MNSELKIIAIVKFNNHYAYVFNREPEFKYKRDGDRLWACDSVFYSCYTFKQECHFKAFAGNKFDLPLIDGGVEHCAGQWWDFGIEPIAKKIGIQLTELTWGTLEILQNCYVFTGAHCDYKKLEQLKGDYHGPIYEYWDYEKVIKYDDMTRKLWEKICYEQKAKKNLIKKVKELSKV